MWRRCAGALLRETVQCRQQCEGSQLATRKHPHSFTVQKWAVAILWFGWWHSKFDGVQLILACVFYSFLPLFSFSLPVISPLPAHLLSAFKCFLCSPVWKNKEHAHICLCICQNTYKTCIYIYNLTAKTKCHMPNTWESSAERLTLEPFEPHLARSRPRSRYPSEGYPPDTHFADFQKGILCFSPSV